MDLDGDHRASKVVEGGGADEWRSSIMERKSQIGIGLSRHEKCRDIVVY